MESRLVIRRALTFAGVVIVGGACSGRSDADVVPGEAAAAAETAALDVIDTVVCTQPAPELAGPGSLVGMAGSYALTMVGAAAYGSIATAEGTLALIEQIPELLEMNSVRTPLYGATDIDVAAVGALPVGDLSSDDAQAPGVLVMESSAENVPRIRLRFGSEANRGDLVRFDGGFTELTVTEFANGGFSGIWRSGVQGTSSDGFFCARSGT